MSVEGAEELVEAAIEGAPIPSLENGHEDHIPPIAAEPVAEAAAIPPGEQQRASEEHEYEQENERELEPAHEAATAGNGGLPEARPTPVDVHAVTEKPASPRRGWWNRLIPS